MLTATLSIFTLMAPQVEGPSSVQLTRVMTQGDIPGLSAAKVERGSVVWNYALGRRDAMAKPDDAAKVNRETVFEAASLGKVVVALATLKLVESGQLELETHATSVVPLDGLKDAQGKDITIRMLLSHSSGLSFGQPTLESAPGTRFSYSTLGFRYLQKIVEAKYGGSLEDWSRRNLFGPLKLKRTSFVYADRFADNRATGRNWLLVGQEQMKSAAGTGAFDLITTAGDYAHLWAAILSGRVLKPSTLDAMFTPQMRITGEFYDPAVPKKSKAELASGLGILLQRQRGTGGGFQGGDHRGATGLGLADRAQQRAFVFLSNAEDGLHAAQPLARLAGMNDAGADWVGYEQITTTARIEWKHLTRRMAEDPSEGYPAFLILRHHDRATADKIARNLGYFSRFRGRVRESEPFFRIASSVDPKDADMLGDWAEALILNGKVQEAADAQRRAIALNPQLATSYKLPEWVRTAKADLAHPTPLDPAITKARLGGYGPYRLVDEPTGLFLVKGAQRVSLVPTRSGDLISRDLAYRVRFREGGVSFTFAGQEPEIFSRSEVSASSL